MTKLNNIPELRVGGLYAGVTVSLERVQFGEKGRADVVFAEFDELIALRDWLNRALPDEPTADPVVTCPACQLGFRISESVPPSKGRFK